MPAVGEQQLKEKIKTSPTGAYLISGDEDYLKKVYVDRIVSAAVEKDFADFNFHKFDGKEADLSEIYDCVEAFPVMSETNCVLVTDMALDSLDDGSMKMLEDIVKSVPETCALVFYMQNIDISSKKWDCIKQLFIENGIFAVLDKKQTKDIVKMVENSARKNGTPFENGTAAYLIECVGNDLNVIHNEMEKLCAYAEGRSVTKRDVDTVCTKSLEAKVFDILKALHYGNFDIAMNKLNAVIAQREEPIKIIGAFVSSYLDIYRARAAVISGLQVKDVMKYYNYGGKDFRLNNALRDGKGLSLIAVYQCLEILAQADDLLKNSAADGVLVLEQTLVKLAVAEGEGRR